ncbi:MAG: hypothetical protein IID45_09655, partial [Planctomycetes bacterium]|nr:hypothetical protein [Planctomycetota bacterium]
MTLRNLIRRLTATPPHKTAGKIASRLLQKTGNALRRRIDERHGTHRPVAEPLTPLNRLFTPQLATELRNGVDETQIAELAESCRRGLRHQFNLLGSGWVNVAYGMKCAGVSGRRYDQGEPVTVDLQGEWLAGRINASNRQRSQKLWQLVDDGYLPIDWQRDFKSGYRWSESTWSRDIRFGHLRGVDIKVPWELARMQHLPQFGIAAHLLPDDDENRELKRRLVREFRNQVLDFLAANPPRYGVNWQCAMDVGIRIANWILARDLFLAGGHEFDADFEEQFATAVHQHAFHIVNNLEWSREFRGNHYLADIAGLLFATASLPNGDETNAWLAFAVQQLIREVEHQFHADGTNFEASICYHRLSAEMAVWCTALVLGFSAENRAALKNYDHRLVKTPVRFEPKATAFPADGSLFPPWYFERLERMAEFCIFVTKPNGCLHQLGDNDSGRFFKLLPECDTSHQTDLDARPLVSAVNGISGRDDFHDFCGGRMCESLLVQNISGSRRIASTSASRRKDDETEFSIPTHNGVEDYIERLEGDPALQKSESCIDLPDCEVLREPQLRSSADFGLYLWRTARCYLAVRCGPVGQNGLGGRGQSAAFT